jgi:rare lipoprotein A
MSWRVSLRGFFHMARLLVCTILGLACLNGPLHAQRPLLETPAARLETRTPQQEASTSQVVASRPAIDYSGRKQRGRAAVYARELAGRRMADGGRFDLDSSFVASSSLPLGTTARVTNPRNGRMAMVRVRDRRSDADGRILTVSPKVAGLLGMRADSVASVVVAPLAVPQADGSVRLGMGTGLAGQRAYITGRDRR